MFKAKSSWKGRKQRTRTINFETFNSKNDLKSIFDRRINFRYLRITPCKLLNQALPVYLQSAPAMQLPLGYVDSEKYRLNVNNFPFCKFSKNVGSGCTI